MDREANVINSPMLNFNCLPTLASEVTTCFRCALAFIRQLKLSHSHLWTSQLPPYSHGIAQYHCRNRDATIALVVVPPGSWCGAISHPGLKGAIISLFLSFFFINQNQYWYILPTLTRLSWICSERWARVTWPVWKQVGHFTEQSLQTIKSPRVQSLKAYRKYASQMHIFLKCLSGKNRCFTSGPCPWLK